MSGSRRIQLLQVLQASPQHHGVLGDSWVVTSRLKTSQVIQVPKKGPLDLEIVWICTLMECSESGLKSSGLPWWMNCTANAYRYTFRMAASFCWLWKLLAVISCKRPKNTGPLVNAQKPPTTYVWVSVSHEGRHLVGSRARLRDWRWSGAFGLLLRALCLNHTHIPKHPETSYGTIFSKTSLFRVPSPRPQKTRSSINRRFSINHIM